MASSASKRRPKLKGSCRAVELDVYQIIGLLGHRFRRGPQNWSLSS